MSDEVTENLLGGIPTGEVLRDPREGDHPDATVSDVEVVEQSNGSSLVVTYGGLTDTEGRAFEYKERYSIPNSNSEDFIHRIFLAAVHDIGVAPRTFKSRILADTPEDIERVKSAFAARKGASVPLRLYLDPKSGYMRSRAIRSKKAA